MYCRNCGKELDDRAVICPYCGVQVGQMNGSAPAKSMCDLAIIGFVLSFFIQIAGLICSIMAYRKCRDENLNGKGLAIAGIVISAAYMAVILIYLIALIGMISCAISMPYYY